MGHIQTDEGLHAGHCRCVPQDTLDANTDGQNSLPDSKQTGPKNEDGGVRKVQRQLTPHPLPSCNCTEVHTSTETHMLLTQTEG